MRSFIHFTLAFYLLSFQAHATDSLNTKIHNQYNSFRALGMGNAFTAVADDYSVMFYNPAVLAKRKKGEIQFTVAGAGVSSKTTNLVQDIDTASKTTGSDSVKAQAIANALDPYYGLPLGGRVQAVELFWVRPNWGIALLPVDLSIDIGVHKQLGPALDLNIKKDSTFAFSYAKEITDTLASGITAKVIHRDSVEQTVSAIELATDSNILSTNRFKEGLNVDFDLGFYWQPAWFAKTKNILVALTNKEIEKQKEDIKKEQENQQELENDKNRTDESTQNTEDQKKINRDPQSEQPLVEQKTDQLLSNTEQVMTEKKQDQAESINANTEEIEVPKPKPIKKIKKIVKYKKIKVTENPMAFSLVIRNVISSNFTKSNLINKEAIDVPSKNPRVIDIGSNYEFAKWKGLTLRATLDFRNLMHPNATLSKTTHAGVEFDYSPNGWFKSQFRAGMNQMYMTAGATFLLGIIEIDAVTYGEEVGTANSNLENRVTALKVGFNF